MSAALSLSDDRRDSPRVPMLYWIDGEAEAAEVGVGDLSLWGVAWSGRERAVSEKVQVQFLVAGEDQALSATGEVLRVTPVEGKGHRVQARFTEVSVEAQLAIARYLRERAA
jgi:hypothetical protein